MAIPDYQSLMLPLLRFAGDGEEHSRPEVVDHLADEFKLTDDERRELLPSGAEPRFRNRVGWAVQSLVKAGLLRRASRGIFRITDRGSEILSRNPSRIDDRFLREFEEYRSWVEASQDTGGEKEATQLVAGISPEESLEAAHKRIRDGLASELLQKTKDSSPSFFEKLVIELLLKMGYGGSRHDAGSAVGGSGDGGVDGIIKEDRLGLDVVYIQAKRWENTVGRPEVQKFAGALQGKRAKKGIMITTSAFSDEAHQFVSGIENKIVLIDGQRLADLMIDFNVGVSLVAIYEVKKIDSDYFEE